MINPTEKDKIKIFFDNEDQKVSCFAPVTNFAKAWISNSVPRAVLCAPRVLVASISTVSSVAYSVLSILTLGQSSDINNAADKFSKGLGAGYIFPFCFGALLGLMNPYSVKIIEKKLISEEIFNLNNCESFFSKFADKIAIYAEECISYEEEKEASLKEYFINHVISRIAFLSAFVIGTITKILDLSLGVFSGALAIVTFGCSPDLNTFATVNLASLNGIYGIRFFRSFVNPYQK